MANYANKYFEEYVEEDSLKEATLCQNTVPDNLIISRISHLFKGHLEEKLKTSEQNIENILAKLQRKTVDVVSPP